MCLVVLPSCIDALLCFPVSRVCMNQLFLCSYILVQAHVEKEG